MTMNLCVFFEYMDPETIVIVEWKGNKIFSSKICDISEDESVMYWIKSGSIVLKDEGLLIPVEHQDEINNRMEKNRKSAGLEDSTNQVSKIRERISILKAIVWAQENHNQLVCMLSCANDIIDFREKLMKHIGFDENQAQAIVDMRNRGFTVKERAKVQEELHMWRCKEKMLF